MTMIILETCDLWDIDYNSDNWEPEFMTIFVTWQLRVTLDSIRNSCDVLRGSRMLAGPTIEKTILETCDIWDTDFSSDNGEPESVLPDN